MKQVIKEEGARPIKIWTEHVEDPALNQLKNISRLPFIHHNGVAAMPDVHMGVGASVGTVIATDKAIIPSAVGVDIGCGMNAVRLSLKASDLPDNLKPIRDQIERDVPLGAGGAHKENRTPVLDVNSNNSLLLLGLADKLFKGSIGKLIEKAASQIGTLGSGNHFIELCIDENQDVWIMLHSGSRGIGNMIGSYFIEKAKKRMKQYFITLPDGDLAYLPEATDDFNDYVEAVAWAQNYAREGDLGIIPGSMGQRSYIVRGKGNLESYCSCSHGAGRSMSRTEAKRRFTVDDLKEQTKGVECNKTAAVLDEIPGAYKDIDLVMENQKDLVEVVHVLKQVLNVKGV